MLSKVQGPGTSSAPQRLRRNLTDRLIPGVRLMKLPLASGPDPKRGPSRVGSEQQEPPVETLTGWRARWGRRIDSPWVWLAGLTLLAATCVRALWEVAP